MLYDISPFTLITPKREKIGHFVVGTIVFIKLYNTEKTIIFQVKSKISQHSGDGLMNQRLHFKVNLWWFAFTFQGCS